ncbi:DedA family protein [Halomarina litorea]|uniref:DedA family protein n=1 Tax=Halomarina litorea TaxID=2961595 RepID=UPI0020C28AED|nr:DedA family protein [Halomarina sp. BCD28]
MDLTQTAVDLVRTYGYLGVFLFTFLESSMLFPLLPSEVVLPAAAAVLVVDPLSLALFAGTATAGVTVGSLVLFVAFARGGERALSRWSFLRVDREDVERGRRWFRRWGDHSVLWGRLLPVLRSIVSIPAGIARMDVRRFALYSAVGGLAFNAAVGAVVYAGRQRSVYHVATEWGRSHPVAAGGAFAVLAAIGTGVWYYVE